VDCRSLLVLVLVVVLVLEKRFSLSAFPKYKRIPRAPAGDSNPASGKTCWGRMFVEDEDDDEYEDE
jgi:hypothetical protein